MTNNQEQMPVKKNDGHAPLVFYLKLLRQEHGERELSREELADILGVPPSMVRYYENLRALPRMLEHLIGAAYVLGARSIEAMIAPRLLGNIFLTLDRRLEERGFQMRRTAETGFREHGNK